MNAENLKEKSYLSIENYEFLRDICDKGDVAGDEWSGFCSEFGKDSDVFGGFSGVNSTANLSSNINADVGNFTENIEKLKHLYRKVGYRYADLNPLYPVDNRGAFLDEIHLKLSHDKEFEMKKNLDSFYLGKISAEFEHVTDKKKHDWLIANFEKSIQNNAENQKRNLWDLMETEELEKFLHVKFPGAKRFSIEGGESAVVIFENFMRRMSDFDLDEISIGMAHRGRLNFLTKVCREPYGFLFGLFKGKAGFDKSLGLSGDVKYHLGASCDRDVNGRSVHLSLLPNPSHLEAVNPVVLGSVRAKQDERGDKERRKIVPFLLHGDASFAGQGIIYETFAMNDLPAYDVGGVVHLIIDNQVGFTACSAETCSGNRGSDIARMVEAPIFHVNGDDVDGCAFVAQLVAEYRARFGGDVVINLLCYRRWGHNEGDEPNFTQPKMYKNIATHVTTFNLYAKKLVDMGVVTQDEVSAKRKEFHGFLDSQMDVFAPKKIDDLCRDRWKCFTFNFDDSKIVDVKSGMKTDILPRIIDCFKNFPDGFEVNSKIHKLLDGRVKMLETGENIDWGVGEMLAFTSLLSEGINIRISGEDVMRGTFAHRHAAVVDQNTNERYFYYRSMGHGARDGGDARFEVYNSILSEYGVMGFDYGYSMFNPNDLVIWEAQFGDFVNGAQIILDQFISGAEQKWGRLTNFVLMLPHGYDGQGPEHSSARIERFLQMCAQYNMRVINPTTPANIFHALRRQVVDEVKKPLVIFTPKSLLRHKLAVSQIADFAEGTGFTDVITNVGSMDSVKKLILCSGKIYYDLVEKLAELNKTDVMLVKIEQLYPFPKEKIVNILSDFIQKSGLKDVIWCQDEPKNMGAYAFIHEILNDWLFENSVRMVYCGRPSSASVAAGSIYEHTDEQKILINSCFS